MITNFYLLIPFLFIPKNKKTPIPIQKSKINTYLRRPKIVLKGNIIELGVLPQARRYHQKN
jgi:hypothetical protein